MLYKEIILYIEKKIYQKQVEFVVDKTTYILEDNIGDNVHDIGGVKVIFLNPGCKQYKPKEQRFINWISLIYDLSLIKVYY